MIERILLGFIAFVSVATYAKVAGWHFPRPKVIGGVGRCSAPGCGTMTPDPYCALHTPRE